VGIRGRQRQRQRQPRRPPDAVRLRAATSRGTRGCGGDRRIRGGAPCVPSIRFLPACGAVRCGRHREEEDDDDGGPRFRGANHLPRPAKRVQSSPRVKRANQRKAAGCRLAPRSCRLMRAVVPARVRRPPLPSTVPCAMWSVAVDGRSLRMEPTDRAVQAAGTTRSGRSLLLVRGHGARGPGESLQPASYRSLIASTIVHRYCYFFFLLITCTQLTLFYKVKSITCSLKFQHIYTERTGFCCCFLAWRGPGRPAPFV